MKSNQKTKFIFLIGLLGLLVTAKPANGQQRISIGPRVGANLSDQRGDVRNNSMLPGWSVGGFIMYSDVSHFGVSADVLFSQKGTKFENANGNNVDYKQRINYLEIPILGRYFLNNSGNFRPNVFIGPSVGFKLNAKQKDYQVNDGPQSDRDNSDDFNAADIGITGGVGLNFQVLPGKRVLLDVRYTYGVSDVTAPTGRVQNSAITLNLAYGFGIGRRY